MKIPAQWNGGSHTDLQMVSINLEVAFINIEWKLLT